MAAFARGGIPEIVADGCGTLVPADDVRALAAAIPRTVALAREAVREHAVRHCSAHTMLAGYLTLYRSMMSNSVVPIHEPRRHLRTAGSRLHRI